MTDKILFKSAVCLLLLWLGGWLFNHFPYPIAGIVVAAAYPAVLLRNFFIKKGK